MHEPHHNRERAEADDEYLKRFQDNVRIIVDAHKGRVVIANRSFREGELIFEEPVLAFGVNVEKSDRQKICLGCARPIFSPYRGGVETHTFTCCCGFKFCSDTCSGRSNGQHDVECGLLQCENLTVAPWKLMLCSRALGTSKDPHLWKQMQSFMGHSGLGLDDFSCNLAEKMAKAFKGAVSSSDVQRIFQINVTNSWELTPNYPFDSAEKYRFDIARWPIPYQAVHDKITCLGFMFCMIEHSCAPNAHPSAWYRHGGGVNLVCRAATDIKIGENISFSYMNYLHLAEGAPRRIERMLKTKAFTCRCRRCVDVTDGGAFTASLRCNACEHGFFLPSAVDPHGKWKCNLCFKQQDCFDPSAEISKEEAAISNSVTPATPMLERREAITKLAALRNVCQAKLHDCHYLFFKVNYTISLMLGLLTEPLSPDHGELLYAAALDAAELMSRLVDDAASEELGLMYFHAARGAASRPLNLTEQWKGHFKEVASLLKFAHGYFRASLGPEHDLTDTSKAYREVCKYLIDIGPDGAAAIGQHEDVCIHIFLGEELTQHMIKGFPSSELRSQECLDAKRPRT